MTSVALAQLDTDYIERLAPGLLGMLGVIVVGWIVVAQVKKRMGATTPEAEEPGGFTLSDLRRLHKSGQVTDEEFEKAKGRVIDAAKRAATRDADATKPAGRRPTGGDPPAT